MSQATPAGLEVSAATLLLCFAEQLWEFANTPMGHKSLLRFLLKRARRVRICMEATGNYGLDVALLLRQNARIELQVANPRAVRRFAEALMQRAKTDRVDARVLREYAARMPFDPWQPPSAQALTLRSLARRLQDLVKARTAERCRLHAASITATSPTALLVSIKADLDHLERQIDLMQSEALRVIGADDELSRRFRLACSLPGVAERSAIYLLGELAALPTDLTARQWVAFAGLDPRPIESGISVKPRHISRHGRSFLRYALYMPGLVAVRHDPHFRAFYQRLTSSGKKPLVAIVACMRKMLHALHALWTRNCSFQGAKLFSALT